MKQTAVQFLKYEMNQMFLTGTLSPIKMKYIIEQALEMEKVQHKKTWAEGLFCETGDLQAFEQYYNETYKSE